MTLGAARLFTWSTLASSLRRMLAAFSTGQAMTQDEFDLAISQHMAAAIRANHFNFDGGYNLPFNTVVGAGGLPGIGFLSGILKTFQDRINGDKAALGLPKQFDFDWRHQLQTPAIPDVAEYYIDKIVSLLVSATVAVLLPHSSAGAQG